MGSNFVVVIGVVIAVVNVRGGGGGAISMFAGTFFFSLLFSKFAGHFSLLE